MHAGVFGARISEEAFQILIDLLESNFAALNIPGDNRSQNNSDAVVISRKLIPSRCSSSLVFKDNLNIRVSHLIQNPNGQEYRGVFEIVLPIFRIPCPTQRVVMSLEDSHEPMEVEEISFTKSGDEAEPFFSAQSHDHVTKSIKKESAEVSRPKIIIRESKLKILEGKKLLEPDMNDNKKPAMISNGSDELQDTETTAEDPDVHKTKSKLRPLVKKDATLSPESGTSYFYYFWQMLFFILFPIAVVVACVSIAREGFDSESCAHRYDATATIRDLGNRVYGQNRGIQELGDSLTGSSSGLKIIAIIGGIGVGKSYAAHIVSVNFPAKKKVFQYVPPLKPRRRFAAGAISVCGCNLIILENLSNRDVPEAANFAEYIAGKIDDVNYCVIIMNVINVQETDDNLRHEVNLTKSQNRVESIYREKNIDVKVVKFEHLDDDAVTKCILDAAKDGNITLTKTEIDDVRISLKISDSGCKGARAKVQLLDKRFDRN